MAAMAVIAGCAPSDAAPAESHVVCRSQDGTTILDDRSKGDIIRHDASFHYESRTTGRSIEPFNATCIVLDDPVAVGWKPIIPGRS